MNQLLLWENSYFTSRTEGRKINVVGKMAMLPHGLKNSIKLRPSVLPVKNSIHRILQKIL